MKYQCLIERQWYLYRQERKYLETRDGERKLYQSDDYQTPVIYNAQTHDP